MANFYVQTEIGKAVDKISRSGGWLKGIRKGIISFIPVEVLRTSVKCKAIEQNWIYLSWRQKAKLQEYMPCYKHHNRSWMKEMVDGAPPPKRMCLGCKMGERDTSGSESEGDEEETEEEGEEEETEEAAVDNCSDNGPTKDI